MGSDPARQREAMVALWRRLREYLGQSWVREYGEVDGSAIAAWSDALRDFTELQIARGVKWCQSWTQDWPPTLGEFRQMCLTVRPEEIRNHTDRRIEIEKREGKPVSMLEHLARHASSPVAKRELERMRRLDAGEDVESIHDSWTILGLHRRWRS